MNKYQFAIESAAHLRNISKQVESLYEEHDSIRENLAPESAEWNAEYWRFDGEQRRLEHELNELVYAIWQCGLISDPTLTKFIMEHVNMARERQLDNCWDGLIQEAPIIWAVLNFPMDGNDHEFPIAFSRFLAEKLDRENPLPADDPIVCKRAEVLRRYKMVGSTIVVDGRDEIPITNVALETFVLALIANSPLSTPAAEFGVRADRIPGELERYIDTNNAGSYLKSD